ncbi:ATP-dependent RNA helicase ddx18 [Halocaridina rubra]|uniref:ATP-dependent RNA helicase n=1 Tax=Halocaridina rubra TaxID=373956 RepID=A0AAN8XN90_HALRR
MAGASILSICKFESLVERGLCSEATVSALNSLGYSNLTAVQLQALPRLLTKENCYIHARTGSGKTLAFLIPTIERLKAMKFKDSHGVGALIISPTRELALQTAKLLQPLAEAHGFSSMTFIGGTKVKDNFEKGAIIVIGTPGKLRKVLKHKHANHLSLKKLRVLVLDEADKLLDDGDHTDHLRTIYSHLPKEKLQKILVSATITDKSMQLATVVLQESSFKILTTETKSVPTTKQIKQNYLLVEAGDRLAMLITVLKTLRKKKVLVFFNSGHSVKFHHKLLLHFDLPVLQCVGQDKQGTRSNAYSMFWESKRSILLATGIAERGWDIPGVQWIILYDPPHKSEDYFHRIGRTGRGDGQTGQALLFLRPEEEKFIKVLQGLNVEINQLEFEGDLMSIHNKVISLVDEKTDIYDKAKVAYKKFVRAYQCHMLKEIFSIECLDLNQVCKSFGFLKPPVELYQLK